MTADPQNALLMAAVVALWRLVEKLVSQVRERKGGDGNGWKQRFAILEEEVKTLRKWRHDHEGASESGRLELLWEEYMARKKGR